MENNLVSERISHLLKEIGFREDTDYSLFKDKVTKETPYYGFPKDEEKYLSFQRYFLPSLYDAQQWLIDNHKLIVLVTYIYEYDSTPYTYCIYKEGSSTMLNEWITDYATYPEALEEGIFQALIYLKIQNEGK